MAVTAAAIVLTAGVLTACGSSPGSPPSGVWLAGAAALVPASAPRTLSETGSSLMAPLFTLWAPAYHARFSQVTLHTVSSSSGAGIVSAAAGQADIGASDAFLSPATLAKYSNLVNIPLAVAALMVVYNVPEYAVVNASQPSATRAQDLRAFLTWAVTSGTAQLAKVHFQPLPPSVITLSDAQIARIKG
jgi:ABC-type phosphate transport system substrate-binding protein